MDKSIIYCLLAALCIYVNSQGQIKQLHIGDEVPALQLTNVLNHSNLPLQLPSPNGKAILLDFFATWCGSCVKELPRLAALQDSMKGRLQIVLVTREPKAKLEAFLQKRQVANAFPVVYEDSILNRHFPNRLLPHDVWIDANGGVAAISYPEYINWQGLQKLISGQALHLPVKRDIVEHLGKEPLQESLIAETLVWKSTLTHNIPGAGHVVGFRKEEHTNRLYEINQAPIKLYMSAWLFPLNRIVLQVKDPYSMVADGRNPEDWSAKYACTYELIGPPEPPDRFRRRMRMDLDIGLGLLSKTDSALLPVWLISPNNRKNISSEKSSIVRNDEQRVTYLTNQTIGVIVSWLNKRHGQQYAGLHFDCSAGCNDRYSLQVPDSDVYNNDALQKILTGAGLAVDRQVKKMEVLVISDALQ